MAEKPAVKSTQPSASGSKVTAPLPSVPIHTTALGESEITLAQFEELGTEELIRYLAFQKVALPEAMKEIFPTQMIDGGGLFGMNKEDLVACGIPMGLASKIVRKIPQ